MRRLGVIVALTALLGTFAGVLASSPALAGRGHKWQLESFKPLTLPAAFCGFKVRVVPVAKAYFKVLKASDGSMLFLATGTLKVSLTNVHTGKTITENASGPSKVTVFPDGSFVTAAAGHNLNFLMPADAQRFGLPTVSVTTGSITSATAADGTITSLSLHGHVLVDVCAALS
jgi:hypothetical protein